MSVLLPLVLSAVVNQGTIDVFYKEMPPSQQVLEEVAPVLSDFADSYEISYYLITDTASAGMIQHYGLPGTHFPFAVVVNGKYTADMDGETIYFVHFPLFMRGIGRHEGNWSTESLRRVLTDNSLLNDENTLPVLDESEETTGCEEQKEQD